MENLKRETKAYGIVLASCCVFSLRHCYLFFILQLIQAGKGEALRIRAILRSLVPIEDLVGVISLSVQIPDFGKGEPQGKPFGFS